MTTDRRPTSVKACSEYDKSSQQRIFSTPPPKTLRPVFERITAAANAEDSAAQRKACSDCLKTLSHFYGIPCPNLTLLGSRPHSTFEDRLEAELFGDYNMIKARIRVWTRTAIKKRRTSTKTILSTLCHEFMHHLDVSHLGFPNSFHTIGFFERTHRLYLAAVGDPYYPIAWQPSGELEPRIRRSINWPQTNRLKARALASAKRND